MARQRRKKVNEAVMTKAQVAKKKAQGKDGHGKPVKKESVDKFQQMLEFLVNEDRAKAEELFHEIVVEKSRSIYEGLLEEEEDESDDEEVDESDDEEVDEGYYAEADDEEEDEDEEDSQEESMYSENDDEEDEESDEDDVEENYYDEAEDDLEMGGDPEGDLSMDMGDEEGDMGDDEMDMDAGEEGADDDRIADLEAELADLKAEFEDMMAGEEGGDEEMDDMGDDEMGDEEGADDMDMGSDEGGDDMDMGDEEPEEEAFQYESKSNQPKSAAEQMREYVEKISGPNFPGPGKMGDNGAYTKSPVASKNDMGGTTANILNGGTSSETNVVGKGGTVQGNGHLNQTPKDMNTGNINVPGGKAGKNTWKNNSAGHGAERKGKPESADKGAGSPLNGAPKRAK
jgi:hypothetical protein